MRRFSKNPSQVAAVCYRRASDAPRFLLVRTSGGRWTFPKGHIEPGLSRAAVAAQEAFEEGGVRGQVDPRPFHIYLHKKRSLRAWGPGKVRVFAFLLEVERVVTPGEVHRMPRWFTPEAAKERLGRNRPAKYNRSLTRVIDRAVERIRRRRY
jgi:phosphohistidine phosphatase